MPNQKIFCNVPWTNTHIYWDGSYGVCCSEKGKPYDKSHSAQFNIKDMGIAEWYNSATMKQVRANIRSNQSVPQCRGCYHEENHGYESRRIKENFKSVIFTEQNFQKSYEQSTGYEAFEHTGDAELPIDWHVDLGNECNLACKMCIPDASSIIASQYKKWNILSRPIDVSWTRDTVAWNRFLTDIVQIKKLNRVHFMGGEPTLSKRFPEFLQYMLDNNRNDISVSFVTNGTIINENIITLLQQFRTCDIEVSIESIRDNNNYIRQGKGKVTETVIKNILYLKSLQNDRFHVVLRSVPQLLNVNNYDQYIRWAHENQLPISGNPLIQPRHYQITVLPLSIRQSFIPQYENLLRLINTDNKEPSGVATGRNVSALSTQLTREVNSILSMLNAPEPPDVEKLREDLIADMLRWDRVYQLDALTFYPEYREFLIEYGYKL
jgi:organic radical activating enzyme